MSNRWTKEEDSILIAIYPCNRRSTIEKKINKDWKAIKRRAHKLSLSRDPKLINLDRTTRSVRKDAWTSEQDEYLKSIFENNTKEYILSKINRPWRGIHARAKMLGLSRNKDLVKVEMIEGGKKSIEVLEGVWSSLENEILKDSYNSTPREKLLNDLYPRTWTAIKSQAFKLNLKRDPYLAKKENLFYTKKAVREKYGVDSYYQTEEFKDKAKATNMRKRGVEYSMQDPEVQNKSKKTVRDNFGVDNVFQSEEIKSKIKSKNMERYGTEYPTQSEEVKRKTRKTNKKVHGVPNTLQLADKVKKGMLDTHGNEIPLRIPKIMDKKKKTSLERYGYEVASKSPEVRAKLSEKLRTPEVKRKQYETRKKNNTFTVSKEELKFGMYLRQIDPDIKHHQLHPDLNQVMDFYSPAYNLWIQYDGAYWHGKENKSESGIQSVSIKRGEESDIFQNKLIPNLVRFDSRNVAKAIDDRSILDLIVKKLGAKRKDIEDVVVCHQYRKRLEHYTDDLNNLPFNPNGLRASDFTLKKEGLSGEIKEFIERYEWLGTIGNTPKWCFTARYKGILAGVVLINEPNAYSSILGKDTKIYEALIQRGASASWAPKNLGSRLIMFACNWMVRNTQKRAFVGYADSTAGERGTIYRACNFEYLGNTFGNKCLYQHSSFDKLFSEQDLRRTSAFRRWCLLKGVDLRQEWFKPNKYLDKKKVPEGIMDSWRSYRKRIIDSSNKIEIPPKMKFLLLKGLDRREYATLKRLSTYKSLPFSGDAVYLNVDVKLAKKWKNNHGSTSDRKTDSKLKYIVDNYHTSSRASIAKELNETPRWVKRQISLLMSNGKIVRNV